MEKKETMTKREFLEIVMGLGHPEAAEFAAKELEKMDRALEKRRSKPTKAQIANAPIIEQIVSEILEGEELKTASEIAEILEISVQKASAVLRQAVSEGKIEVEDVKVKGKGTQKGYRLRSEKVEAVDKEVDEVE
jgi:DNA-binding transcriptional regulator YhcF (GntR family)